MKKINIPSDKNEEISLNEIPYTENTFENIIAISKANGRVAIIDCFILERFYQLRCHLGPINGRYNNWKTLIREEIQNFDFYIFDK